MTATGSELANTPLDAKLVSELFHLNFLTPFPVGDDMLENWAVSLQELEPMITPEVVKWICDNMKIGRIGYDNKKGIQNVFIGFRAWIRVNRIELGKEKYTELHEKYKKGANIQVESEYSANQLFGTE